MQNLETRIEIIEKRNRRVELDKAWETSMSRKILIAILTYIVIVIFFWTLDLGNPFINAIVPTIGFLLSTLTLGYFKNIWISKKRS